MSLDISVKAQKINNLLNSSSCPSNSKYQHISQQTFWEAAKAFLEWAVLSGNDASFLLCITEAILGEK